MAHFQSSTAIPSGMVPSLPFLTGQFDRVLRSPKGGTYRVSLTAEDQVQLHINGVSVLDTLDGVDAANGGKDAQVRLPAGNHHVQLRYQDDDGTSRLHLRIHEMPIPELAAPKLCLEIRKNGSKTTLDQA